MLNKMNETKDAWTTMSAELIEEASSDKWFDTVITHLAKQTDQNDHSGALVTAAGIVDVIGKRRTNLVKIFKAIEEIHEVEGHMPPDLMKYRERKRGDLDKIAKKAMTPEQFKRFHGSM